MSLHISRPAANYELGQKVTVPHAWDKPPGVGTQQSVHKSHVIHGAHFRGQKAFTAVACASAKPQIPNKTLERAFPAFLSPCHQLAPAWLRPGAAHPAHRLQSTLARLGHSIVIIMTLLFQGTLDCSGTQ